MLSNACFSQASLSRPSAMLNIRSSMRRWFADRPKPREEIDSVIATTVAGFELASEQARRRRWQHRVANADRFKSEALQRSSIRAATNQRVNGGRP
jgi:hypothetical protein